MASSRNNPSTKSLEQTLRERLSELPRNARVAVAFSGGLDSTVLLHLMADYARQEACALSAIHVHHGLSPNADDWTAFCRVTCARLNIPLALMAVEVPRNSGEGLEASARRLRYSAFEACAADHIVLAHHANDQAETLLFNLMRGTGIRGAAGMQASASAGRYLRPLLTHTRRDLEAYARAHDLDWVEDESNARIEHSRNYIRHEVMPVLERRFPAAVGCLVQAAEHFAEAQLMMDEMARHDLGDCGTFPLPVDLLRRLSPARGRNVLRYLLASRGLQSPSTKRLQEIFRQFLEAAPDRHPCIELATYRLCRRRGLIDVELD